jgi:glutamate--cysteine ligase
VTLTRSDLRREVRDLVFGMDGSASAAHRIGMEVELIPVRREDRTLVLPDSPSGTGEVFARVSEDVGWRSAVSPAGAPAFAVPGGGAFSFEPGGQVEYSSAVHDSIDGLCAGIDRALAPVLEGFSHRGIDALGRGIDPTNPVESARLVLDSERYTRLARHMDGYGLAGRRMMRQTAAIHLNLELGPRPLERWELANRLAPYLIGIFANSSIYEGALSGFRSFRAQQWRELDQTRSGLVLGEDPVDAYLEFGLGASALFMGGAEELRRPLSEWIAEGVEIDMGMWRRHLSTLFPEVRARGYLELRGIDALDPRDYAAPAVLAAGVLYDERATQEAADFLPAASVSALARAGRTGISDPVFRTEAIELWRIALAGARRLEGFIGLRSLRVAERFYREYTELGLDPATTAEANRTARAI